MEKVVWRKLPREYLNQFHNEIAPLELVALQLPGHVAPLIIGEHFPLDAECSRDGLLSSRVACLAGKLAALVGGGGPSI